MKSRCCLLLVWLLINTGDLKAAEFVEIGVDQELDLVVNGISADGRLVVGRTLDETWNSEAFIWSRSEGVQILGTLPGHSFSSASSVSADGDFVVGESRGASGNQVFYWTSNQDMQGLDLAGFNSMSLATVSADAHAIVATAFGNDFDRRAVRWTQETGFVSLLPPNATGSTAAAVAADGSVVAGAALTGNSWEGFIWTEQDGFRVLGPAPEDWIANTDPRLVSRNGRIVFGNGNELVNVAPGGSRGNPFRWTFDHGIERLPILEGVDVQDSQGSAEDITPDGSVLVGDFCGDGTPGPTNCVAFSWNEKHDTRSLRDVLLNEHGFVDEELPWLDSARGISADATIVTGYNNALSRTSPRRDAWIIYLDKPLVSPLGDFNSDHYRDALDIDLLSMAVRDGSSNLNLDENLDGIVDEADRSYWVHELAMTYYGDANLDGEFNSSDLVTVFESGQYEDAVVGNSGWATGDWNGDAEFSTSDLVLAFQDGGYEQGPRADAAVPEPSPEVLLIGAIIGMAWRKASHNSIEDGLFT